MTHTMARKFTEPKLRLVVDMFLMGKGSLYQLSIRMHSIQPLWPLRLFGTRSVSLGWMEKVGGLGKPS